MEGVDQLKKVVLLVVIVMRFSRLVFGCFCIEFNACVCAEFGLFNCVKTINYANGTELIKPYPKIRLVVSKFFNKPSY